MIPNGAWDDPFDQLIRLHRTVVPGLIPGAFIDQGLWNAVVGGTHLDATGSVTPNAADPLAVYRPSWHTPTALTASATEVDVIESVQPVAIVNDAWSVYREQCTVDVLLHHRDTRTLDPADPIRPEHAFAMLLWQSGPSRPALLATNLAALPVFAAGLAGGGPLGPVPGGWNIATDGAGSALHALPVRLDARVPRAVSIDVNLANITAGHFVLFMAVAGSTVDPCTAPTVAPINTIAGLVRGWPHAAARLVRVFPR